MQKFIPVCALVWATKIVWYSLNISAHFFTKVLYNPCEIPEEHV